MSSVIEFRSNGGRAGSRDGGNTAGEVIIFPGVRRERHAEQDEMPPKSRRASKAKPKRDRIELPD